MSPTPLELRRYPPSDAGFDPCPVDELLLEQTELLDRIQLNFGLDAASFAEDIRPAIAAYAGYVHLLPATASDYFGRPGGLLALGLEVGFFALQGTDAHIFSGQSTISTRRLLEPRWRHATFLGGLCCELHRALATLVVTDDRGNEWPAYRQPLAAWLTDGDAERYFIRWRPKASEARGLALFALPYILAPATLQYLDEGNSTIVPHLLASIGGLPAYGELNGLDSLVRRSLALVVDRDLRANADRYGTPRLGSHLERYFVDALRRLAAMEPSWRPNREKSRVWHGADGVFLAWPQCAADVQALLEGDRLPGIPKSHDTVLDVLLAAGIAEPRGSSEPTWSLVPPGAKSPVVAIKLTSPALLWPSGATEPEMLDRPLHADAGSGTNGSASPPPEQPAPEPGTQLSLLEAEPESERQPTPSSDGDAAAPAPPHLALQVPMRLNPVVRDGLAAIVETLNGDARAAAACTVANGIFVPLAELERRGVQPALALRALGDLHLLIRGKANAPPTTSRDFGGSPQIGLVLDPRCVSGLDLAAFVPPPTEPS